MGQKKRERKEKEKRNHQSKINLPSTNASDWKPEASRKLTMYSPGIWSAVGAETRGARRSAQQELKHKQNKAKIERVIFCGRKSENSTEPGL